MNLEQSKASVASLESTPWLRDPESTSSHLEPKNPFLLKTLPPASEQIFSGPIPRLDREVSRVNGTYLEVVHGLMLDRWAVILISPLAAMTPFLIPVFEVYFWLEDGSQGWSFAWISLLLMALSIYGGWPLITIAAMAYEDEPFRFDRKQKKLYWFRAKRSYWPGFGLIPKLRGGSEVKIYEWKDIRAEITRKVIFNGKTARRDCFLELAVLDPISNKVVERFRVGDRDVLGEFRGRLVLWETIRRYMEEGPQSVPEAPYRIDRRNFIDAIHEFNLLAIAHQFGSSVFMRMMGAFIFIICVPFAAFFLAAGLAKWIGNLTARKVDWGELDHTVFKLSPDDPSLKRSQDPAIADPQKWQAELRYRKRMTWVWFAFVIAELGAFLWWIN